MSEPINFDFGDLNLDFLELSPPQPTQGAPQIVKCVLPTPDITSFQPYQSTKINQITAEQSDDMRRRKYRIEELAKRIANVDLYSQQIKSFQKEHKESQKQLYQLQSSADDIRKLYVQEKEERTRLQSLTNELSIKCESLKKELANKTFLCDQMDSHLKDINNCPIPYKDLALGYLNLLSKYEEHTKATVPTTTNLLADHLRTYCKEKSMLVPEAVKRSPKKRAPKVVKKHSYVQCEIWKNAPTSISSPPASKPKQVRSQGTQYFSTTTTRSTCTSAIVMKRTVGTCFPEQPVLPPFNEIVKELSQWDIQPLSPLCEVEPLMSKTVNKGTCTTICNIQRTVDYIGSGYHPLTSIKQSSSRPPSRTMLESVKHEMFTPPPLSPPVNFSHLGTMESSTANFDDLWHIFGQMLFSILRNRQGERFNTATRNVGNAPCTQQEFNQWLTSIYGNASEQPEQKISRGKPSLKSDEQKTSGKEDNHVDYKNIVTSALRLLNPCTASENSLRNTEDRQQNTDVSQQNHGAFSTARSFCSSSSHFSTKDLPRLSLDQKENDKLRLSSECLSETSGFHIPQPTLNETKNFNGLKTKKPKSHHSANVADEILKLFPKLENSEVIRTKINKLVKKKSKGKHKKLKKFKECITSEAQHTDLSGKVELSAESADEPEKQFIVEEEKHNENEMNVTTSKFEGKLEESLNIVENQETQLPSPEELELAQDSLRSFSPMSNKEEGNLEEVENNKNVLNSYQFDAKVEVKKAENLLKIETKPTLSVPSIDLCETAVEFIMELPSFTDDSDKYKNSITADEYKIAEWSTLHSNQKQCKNPLERFDVRKPKVRNIDSKKKPPKDINKLMFDLFGSETEDSDNDDENNLKPLQNHFNSNELQSDLQQTKSTRELLQYHAFHDNVLHNNSMDTNESYQKNQPINEYSSFQPPEEDKLPPFKFIKSVKDKEPVKQLPHMNSLLDYSFPENEASSHIPVLQQPVHGSQSLQYNLCHQNMASSNSSPICIENMVERNSTPPKELPQEATIENELCQGQSLIFQEWVKKEQPSNILYEIPLEDKTSTELCQQFWDENVTPEKSGELVPYSSSSLSDGGTTTHCESAERTKDNEITIAMDENNTQYIKNITQIPTTFVNSYQLKDSQKTDGTFKKPQQLELPNVNKGIVNGFEGENEHSNELNLVIDETDSNTGESSETSNSFLTVASVSKNAVDEEREEAEKCNKLQPTPAPKLNRTDVGTSLNTSIFIPKKESSENISNASPANEIIQPEDKLIDDKHNRFHNYLYHMLQDVGPRSISPISNISSLSPTSSVKNQPKKRGRKRKSEMSQPATKLPPTANIACKRSERLRVKRMARTMTESYNMPTPPSIAVGKYTAKRVYDTNKSKFEVKEDVAISHQAVDDEDSMQINLGFFTERDAIELDRKEIQETGNEKESEKILKTECETKVEEISSLSTEFQESCQYKSIEETKKCIVYPQTQPQQQKSKEDNQTATEANETEAINNNNKSHCDMIPEDERLSSSSSPLSCTQNDLPASLPLYQQYDSSAAFPPETKIDPSEVNHNPAKVSLESATQNATPASLPLSQQYYSCAASPPETKIDPSEVNHNPAKVSLESATQNETKNIGLLAHLIANYKNELYKLVTDSFSKKTPAKTTLLSKLCKILKDFLVNTTEAIDQLESSVLPLVNELYAITQNLSLITEAIVVVIQQAPRPEVELNCLLADVPQKYLGTQHRRLSFVIQRFQMLHPQFLVDLQGQLENTLFHFDTNEKLSLSAILNITQLYLLIITIQLPQLKVNPARLFVAKCLYYYKVRAIPMIYEVLCCFPTTLPHREERDYDRSDALITVIQHLLMTTKYDMNSKDLFTKQLLSKLRFEYHFEPFKPERSEVLTNLVDKLRAGKLENVPYAMALFCKRMPQPKVEADVLQAQLLPLVYEYYRGITASDAHDDTIAGLLECISMVIKPFRLDTDIDLYLSIFTRFLNVTDRPRIQEAAVQAILRCQRFGYVNCFNALVDFKPFFDLKVQTKAMLQTFIYRRSAKFLRHLLKISAF